MGSRSRPPGVPHCPSKVCDFHSLPPVRHRPGSHLSWSFARFRVLYETVYRAVWVARSRLDVIVFTNRLRGLRPVSVSRLLTHPASSSRALVRSCRVSRVKAGPAEAELLPWAFLPSSRRHSAESTSAGVPSPLRSALDVSHVLDGLLLCQTLRVCFAPQPRPGFALQGFPLTRSRGGSSPAVALMSFTLGLCFRGFTLGRASPQRPPSGPCSSCQSVAEAVV